jgi:hypothetical protein
MLHKETITPELLEVLQSLMSMGELAAFQLVGGTECRDYLKKLSKK